MLSVASCTCKLLIAVINALNCNTSKLSAALNRVCCLVLWPQDSVQKSMNVIAEKRGEPGAAHITRQEILHVNNATQEMPL